PLEIIAERETILAAIVRFAQLNENDVSAKHTALEIARNLREMTRNDSQQSVASEASQAADCTETAEAQYVGMFALQRTPRSHTAHEDARMPDSMPLFEQLLNQRRRLARALSPNDVIAGLDKVAEIE